ncbi:TonB-dependent receptor [Glaciecola sp. MH2013]|uniref:TonB-dependent receptor n=1 Tax=Glaciecola sp. MH2013 TaxID=2785524 RepID=UPI00189CDBD2|nr:TonB-dependent receptor [Glaciecola sp. MH2013]MBF7072448.1 TonB-dependent receptor [Glaciecola sp. MH2013]
MKFEQTHTHIFSNTTNSTAALRHVFKPTAMAMLISAALSFSPLANAMQDSDEDAIERIIVTSDLGQREANNLATSVAIVGPELMELRQATHLEDILAVVPNLNFSSGASRGKFVQIRGIGERSQFAEPINPSVALVVDEINFSGIGGLATLVDVQQVEVLSGPQSTGFGATGLAGIVKVVSNKASDTAEGYVQGSIGQFNTLRLTGAYSDKLTDGVNARVALQKVQSDGFVENIHLGREDTNNIDELSARVSIDANLSETSDLEFKFYHFDIDNGYDAFSLDNNNKTRSDEPGFDRTETQAASAKYIYENDDKVLSVAATFLTADLDYAYDEDWTFVGFHPDEYSSFDRYSREVNNHTIDARYASIAADSPWVVGLYYQASEQDLRRIYTFASADFTSTYDPSSIALYGEYSWQVNKPLSITAGARLEKFEADYIDSSDFTESLDDNLIAAKVSASYVINKATLFSSVSRSYKAGGFNPDQRVSEDDRLFDPEYNWNYELGVKGRVNTRSGIAGQLSVTFFYMEREDAQVSDFSVERRDGNAGGDSFIDVIGNADTGLNKGVEIQTNWQFSDSFATTINFGYLDATFGNYTRTNGSFIPKQKQAQAPKITFYVASNYAITDDISWVLELEGKDRHRFSIGHDERSPFTALVNTHITLHRGDMSLQLWAKNIFDREVLTRGFGGFNNDPRDGYDPAKPYYQFGQERQLGATLTYRF